MSHIVHGIFIERLQFHGSRFVCRIAGPFFGCHEILYIFFPEQSIVLSLTVDTCQFQGTYATASQFAELLKPGAQFVQQLLVGTSGFQLCRNLFDFLEFRFKCIGGIVVPVGHTERTGFPRFVSPVSVLCITRVDGKRTVSLSGLRHQFGKPSFPTVHGIVVGKVPGIVGYSVQCQFRSLSVLHRVAHYTAYLVGSQ